MRFEERVMDGTLNPDGTLDLDQRPNLSPGRVKVMLRQESMASSATKEDWWECLQRIRADREKVGYPFMNEEQVNAHMACMRQEDPIDELLREVDGQRSG